jgi:hypothetical protein
VMAGPTGVVFGTLTIIMATLLTFTDTV